MASQKSVDSRAGVRTPQIFASRVLTLTDQGFQTWKLEPAGIIAEHTWTPYAWAGLNVHDVAISGDGNTVLTTHGSGAFRVWDVSGPKLAGRNPLHPQPVHPWSETQFQFSDDGTSFATHAEDGLAIWQIDDGSIKRLPIDGPQHTDFAPIAFLDNRTILDNFGHLWGAQTDRVRLQRETPLLAQALHVMGHHVLTWTDNDLLWVDVSVQPPKIIDRLPGVLRQFEGQPHPGIHAMAANARVFAVGGMTGSGPRVLVMDIREDRLTPRPELIPVANALLYRLALSSDGQSLVTCSGGGLEFWTLDGEQPQRRWHRPGYSIAATFRPDGRSLVASYGAGGPASVSLIDTENGELMSNWSFPGDAHDVVFAPDGRHVLIANANGTVYIMRLTK